MKHRTFADRVFDWTNSLALLLIAAVMLVPFLYVFSISFTTYKEFLQNDFILLPKTWTIEAYQFIFESSSFVRSLWLTAVITIVGTLVNIAMTASLAYSLSRNMWGRGTLMFMVLFTMLFSAGMIPTYIVVKETGLLDSIWSLILPVAISPFYLIVMRQFFMGIPNELTEAAVIDGANDLQIIWKVITPLSKPALAAFGLFYAVSHWNNYFTGVLYLNDPAKWPIQVILRQIVTKNEATATLANAQALLENPPPAETIQMAAILVATVPILIVYPFLQKHFAKGVMLGSVKG
ncbi:carbohydrate ABC transporter permease [Paenibacillus flagellatus]|uniref:ABC transporter permease n=1 Tax=Paenibacillus flagellatus TaxID=2211139 RepID=A0A2V5KCQ4_9BACL|nr:carbohydrate ABC transporter permease [Paenibacillus flagellatus]PYI57405.1 ABC transporter permease [Paenibacillus flagellatus]